MGAEKRPLVVHGNGSHGRVVTSAALKSGRWTVRITDDAEDTRPGPNERNIIAIGNCKARASFDNPWLVSIIDPGASVHPSARVGPGTFIADGACVNVGAVIGRGCIINTSAIVEHDCEVGDWCHLSPMATLCGTVKIGRFCWLGANCTILNDLTICDDVIIGGGAVVVKNITEPGTYIGNPALKTR